MDTSTIRSGKRTHLLRVSETQRAVTPGAVVAYHGSQHARVQAESSGDFVVIDTDDRGLLTLRDRIHPRFILRHVRRTSVEPTGERAQQCTCGNWCEHYHNESSLCHMRGCHHEPISDERAAELGLA